VAVPAECTDPPASLQRDQSRSFPKPGISSRRDQQGAATLHEIRKDTVTLVPLKFSKDKKEAPWTLEPVMP